MNLILFDPARERAQLRPFTFTRPIAAIRCGILTIAEKWEKALQTRAFYKTDAYLQTKFPFQAADDSYWINGSVFPDTTLIAEIQQLAVGQALYAGDTLVAARSNADFQPDQQTLPRRQSQSQHILQIQYPQDIFSKNGEAIERDFAVLTAGRTSQPIPEHVQTVFPERIFIEEGASVLFSILNATNGPIYIGKDSEIMEGCKVRGPFALCEHAGLKMDAKIYGPTTVGPHCKVGGEVNNSVFFSYSNKGHDGFVGNAVIGEWVNMGADTNNSNLKNIYDEVKLWSYVTQGFEPTGLTFCGLMMADHAKCGINTMFNTGTVVGVGANVFGPGFPRNFVPDFAWGGAQGFSTFQLKKFHKMAEAMCLRRNYPYNEMEQAILEEVFKQTQSGRYWETKPSV